MRIGCLAQHLSTFAFLSSIELYKTRRHKEQLFQSITSVTFYVMVRLDFCKIRLYTPCKAAHPESKVQSYEHAGLWHLFLLEISLRLNGNQNNSGKSVPAPSSCRLCIPQRHKKKSQFGQMYVAGTFHNCGSDPSLPGGMSGTEAESISKDLCQTHLSSV